MTVDEAFLSLEHNVDRKRRKLCTDDNGFCKMGYTEVL
jgi:hypothetical protein